jgi:hypothetical protein
MDKEITQKMMKIVKLKSEINKQPSEIYTYFIDLLQRKTICLIISSCDGSEEFEEIKGVTRIRKSKDRQHNGFT